MRLLAQVCRPNTPAATRYDAAVDDAFTDGFVALTVHHQVLPLVVLKLGELEPGRVPVHVLEHLDRLHRSQLRGRLASFAEFRRVAGAFEDRGIKAVTLKGFHLAQVVYGDVFARQVGDLDFMVPPADVGAAVDTLLGLGYRWRAESVVERIGPDRVLASATQWGFKEARNIHVDLHWGLEWSRGVLGLSAGRMLERAERAVVEGTPVWALPRVELLPFLVVHGTSHRWEQLRWVVDVAELIERMDDGELAGAVARLKALGAERELDTILWLLRALWGDAELDARPALPGPAPVPAPVRRTILAGMESLGTPPAGMVDRTGRYLRALGWRVHLGGSPLKQLGAVLRPGLREWELVHLPRRLHALYWLVRPVRRILIPVAHLTGRPLPGPRGRRP